ncbi:MAG: YraN family protein [Clostridiales bacterium]|nr:YraN family protein [Clostridiales bacterium]
MGEKCNKRAVGSAYEKIVGEYLGRQNYQILEYNFRCRIGEIDLIAKEGGYLVFIEVKYRDSEKRGNPLEAVTRKKQRIISKVASYYCVTHGYGEETPCRFDVAAVLGEKITVIKNAFEYQG